MKLLPARQRRQFARLETLVDCVYAVVIVLLVANLPVPSDAGHESLSLPDFLSEQYEEIIGSVMGLVLVVVYWIQHNSLFAVIDRTDNRHTVISLVQLILLLIYFYATGLAIDFQQVTSVLILQSVALALMGVASLWGLAYSAKDRRLLAEDTTDADASALRVELLAEPATAALTIPVAFAGVDAWSLAWLGYPAVAWIVRRIAASEGE